jgi:hypothetical protein
MEDSIEKELIRAIKQDNLEKVNDIIGEDVDVETITGKTPIHLAVQFNKIPIIEFLIQKGANINKQTHNGTTPLHVAADEENNKVIEILLRNGADENIKNYSGNKPMSKFMKENNITTILLENYNKMDMCFSFYGSLKCPLYTKEEADILKAQIREFEFLEKIYRRFRNKTLASSAFNLSKSHKFKFLDLDTENELLNSMIDDEYDSNIPLFKEEEDSSFNYYSTEDQQKNTSSSKASNNGGRKKSRKSRKSRKLRKSRKSRR